MSWEQPEKSRFDTIGNSVQLVNIDLAKNKKRYYYLALTTSLFNIVLVRAWGRIGSRSRVKEDWFDEMNDALVHANRIFRQKCSRGYIEVDDIRDFNGRDV